MGVRSILHLDLDAFYASVEQLDDPALRGRPVIVGGTSRARGGLRGELRGAPLRRPLGHADRRGAAPLPGGRLPRRRASSATGSCPSAVFGIYRRYTPLVEPLSLDEAFLDVTAAARSTARPGTSHAQVQGGRSGDETGLTVSAGVADVKLAAKIASDLGKPDGLVEVPAGTACAGVPGAAAGLAPVGRGRGHRARRSRGLGVTDHRASWHAPGAPLARRSGGARRAPSARSPAARTRARSCPTRRRSSVAAEETFAAT